MRLDEVIAALGDLSSRSATDALATLDRALVSWSDVPTEALIAAAYIAGLEDGVTAMAGRPEYDLRRLELMKRSGGTLSERGRVAAQRCMDDLIAQARDG